MKKELIGGLVLTTVGLASYATTFLNVELFNDIIEKYDVMNVEQMTISGDSMILERKDGISAHYGVSEIIQLSLSSEDEECQLDTFGHEFVDMGLSVKWATCNVGAEKPENVGYRFSWGEIIPDKNNDWISYKWSDGRTSKLTKYCFDSLCGKVDSLKILLPEDDAATAHWGSEWHTPTCEEWAELINNCAWYWDKINGVEGYTVVADNGNSIFLPSLSLDESGVSYYGYYLSSSVNVDSSRTADDLLFTCNFMRTYSCDRINSYPVRPVKKNDVEFHSVKFFSSDSVLLYSRLVAHGDPVKGFRPAEKNGYVFMGWSAPLDSIISDLSVYATYKERPESLAYSYVDLGLSVKWATFNVGASVPEEYGDYYATGEIETKAIFERNSYKWYDSTMSIFTKYNRADGLHSLLREDDAATKKWGAEWRTPSRDEWQELVDNCEWIWTNLNYITGYKVVAKNGNWIFLPAGDDFTSPHTGVYRTYGGYGSSTFSENSDYDAYCVLFDNSHVDIYDKDRHVGRTIRPVLVNEDEKPNYEYVDLGLSVDWATFNVGASQPEDFGLYFSYGETRAKNKYNRSSYKWLDTETKTYLKYNFEDNLKTILPEDDAATVNWGDGWRIATIDEWMELREKCMWIWTDINDVKGYKVTSSNGNSIFLPIGGESNEDPLYFANDGGSYWSSTLDGKSEYFGYSFGFTENVATSYTKRREYGLSVRPVRTK